ncbi:hypothetical protein [Clostridium beijerinckii]|uniref:hypothetical protein n=1 Tax=Clostridium beijerinckii TaxID=1520 RepID=UPI0014943EB8|nr:hypothetical protein [Clostridium beijerinckii]NOW07207.1 hypothetical protein [Clostridium beijerinckii]NYC05019.1 hypothetical protein [Clostridium beijerinckii]
MESVLVRREMELGLENLFVKANVTGNFADWFKSFRTDSENEKADQIKSLIDKARNNSEIFTGCDAVYNEKDNSIIMWEVPKVLYNGNRFTHVSTQKTIEYIDFVSLINLAVEENLDMGYMNCQAYYDFDEENHGEEYWGKHYKVARNEEDKYSMLEHIVGISYYDMEKHFVSAYYEDLDEIRMFAKFDNGIEIVIDKLG